MKLENLGQVIASRSIKIEGQDEIYTVSIGLPRQFSDSMDFYCPVQIASETHKGEIMYSAGIDSVQALQLALRLIGGTLFRLNRECEGKLRWDGDEHGDLGFPLPE